MRNICLIGTLSLLFLRCGGTGSKSPDATADTTIDVSDDAADTSTDGSGETQDEAACSFDADCDDDDPCTLDRCDMDQGECTHDPVDADGDGYPASTMGVAICGGTDCDDADDSSYPGAPPVCDGADHDCSGHPDDDEDEDGYLGAVLCPSTGDDCNDADASIHPGATEICLDGIDQDCDGWVDGPMLMGDDLVVADGSYPASEPDMEWTGSEYGITWRKGWEASSRSDVHFMRISADGTTTSTDIVLTSGEGGASGSGCFGDPSLVSNGYEFAIAMFSESDSSTRSIWFDTFDFDGTRSGPLHLVVDNSDGTSHLQRELNIVWDGARFAMAWFQDYDVPPDYFESPYFLQVSIGGSPVSSEVRLTSVDDLFFNNALGIAWTGSEYGTSWSSRPAITDDVYFVRVGADGSRIGGLHRIVEGEYPVMTWTGSEYGIAYSRDDSLWHMALGGDGSILSSEFEFATPALAPLPMGIVWTGSSFGVAWWSHVDGLSFTRYRPDGTSDDVLTVDALDASLAVMHWTGSEVGIAWQDGSTGASRILFNRIGFCQ